MQGTLLYVCSLVLVSPRAIFESRSYPLSKPETRASLPLKDDTHRSVQGRGDHQNAPACSVDFVNVYHRDVPATYAETQRLDLGRYYDIFEGRVKPGLYVGELTPGETG